MNTRSNKRRTTLTDAAFLIALILLLTGVSLPAISQSRAQSRRSGCSNNMKQLGLALHTYHDTYRTLPPNGLYLSTRGSRNGSTWGESSRGSVFVKLLPYFEQSPMYNELSFEVSGKDGMFENQAYKGKPVRSHVIPLLLCPARDVSPDLDGKAGGAISSYAPSMGSQRMDSRGSWCLDYPGNVFGTGPVNHGVSERAYQISGLFARAHWAAKFRDIVDGQSQVIAMGEIRPNKGDHHSLGWANYNSLWTATTAPINYPIRGIGEAGFPGQGDCSHYQNLQTSQGFKSTHAGGAIFVMGDGATTFIAETVDYVTLQRLGDRRDGQPLGRGWVRD